MDTIEKITIGNEDSNRPKRLFINLMNTFFQRSRNYETTLTELTKYFCLTGKIDEKDKSLIIMYIISKYIELNHYRNSLGILNPEDESQRIIKDFEKNHFIKTTSSNLRTIINDAIYSIACTDTLFQQGAINSSIKSGLNKKLYMLSPSLFFEHMETLMEGFSEKEQLLETIKKAVSITYDRRMLLENIHPTPKDKLGFLKNVRFPSTFHQEVLKEYNKELNITEEENEKKVLICEMIYSILNKKEKTSNLSFSEYHLLQNLRQYPITKEGLSQFYNEHGIEIIHYLIANMDKFEILKKEGILEDQLDFVEAKRKKKD